MEDGETDDPLAVLRSRSDEYRAVSILVAWTGGLLSVILSAWIVLVLPHIGAEAFFWLWLVVYLVVDLANTVFLRIRAAQSGRDFVTESTVYAIGKMMPGYLVGAVAGPSYVFLFDDPVAAAAGMTLGAGVLLWGTRRFAPRGLFYLGVFWLLAAAGWWTWHQMGGTIESMSPVAQGAVVMGTNFGGGLLVYAALAQTQVR